jgi:Tol biopolymer transport system component
LPSASMTLNIEHFPIFPIQLLMRRFLLLFACLFTAATVLADDAANEARFITNARQLIFEGKRSGEGYFSPDGQKLIFQSEREEDNPFYQMYILDLRTGDTTRVSPGFGKTTCGFFQPGTNRVLFASTHEDPEAKAKQKAELDFRASGKVRRYSWDYDATMDIFSANQDGSDKVNLTHSLGYDAEGGYSPDGKQIVFCSLRGAFPLDKLSPEMRARYEKNPSWFGDIYIMNADGSNVRQLTEAPGYDGGPFFSPDGTRIVWRHFDENGMIADVWTMKTDGSDKHRVTDFKSMSWAPFYHPSGKYIIFTSNKLGFTNFELFIVDVNGEHEPVRVTYTDGFDGLPVFSPDGKKISWTSGRTSDGKSQIFLADWNDEAALQAIAQSPLRAQSASAASSSAAQSATASPNSSAASASSAASTSVAKWTHSPEVTAAELKSFDEWLADPAREGRETGTQGAKESADYISGIFHNIRLQPLNGNYREPFEFNAGARVDEANTSLSVESGKAADAYKLDQDFRPLAFSESGSVHGEVVFAGYGLSVPEDAKNTRYNSYDGLDVKDKIVLFFRYAAPSSIATPACATKP